MGFGSPVIFSSQLVISWTTSELMGWFACFWALAVGPPFTASSCPVIFFSSAVILDIISESTWEAMVRGASPDQWGCARCGLAT
jgi:hypothetical protein